MTLLRAAFEAGYEAADQLLVGGQEFKVNHYRALY
jgi:hypothetical protein